MTYKFKSNLLDASYSSNYDIALQEWKEVKIEKREEIDRVCICTRKIKNVHHMFNSENGNMIQIGFTCFEKFSMKKIKISNNTVQNVCLNFLSNSEYISDFDIEEQLKIYMKQFIESLSNLTDKKLFELLNDLEEIKSKYEINSIILKLNQEIQRRKEIERETRERREERERLEKIEKREEIERREEREKREERERREKRERETHEEVERLEERKRREERERRKRIKEIERAEKINLILQSRCIDMETYNNEQKRKKEDMREKRKIQAIQKIKEKFNFMVRNHSMNAKI